MKNSHNYHNFLFLQTSCQELPPPTSEKTQLQVKTKTSISTGLSQQQNTINRYMHDVSKGQTSKIKNSSKLLEVKLSSTDNIENPIKFHA